MNATLLLLALALPLSAPAQNACSCKCVVKQEDGSYGTEEASGKDREAAGEALKKKLKKRTCELSPVCSGTC